MKNIHILSAGIMLSSLLFGGFTTYANTDNTLVSNFNYSCTKNAAGEDEGVLTLEFQIANHHKFVRIYKINNAGTFTVSDDKHVSVGPEKNLYIEGCGCPEPLAGNTVFPAIDGKDFGYEYYGDDNGKEIIPLFSGDISKWVYITHEDGGKSLTTTDVLLKPSGNGGVPASCVKCEGAGCESCNTEKKECTLSVEEDDILKGSANRTMHIKSNFGANIVSGPNLGGNLGASTNQGKKVDCKEPTTLPRVVCDAEPSTVINASNTRFEIPASIMNSLGTCTVTFGGSDSCNPTYTDTVSIVQEPRCELTSTKPGTDFCFTITDKVGLPLKSMINKVIIQTFGSNYVTPPVGPQTYTESSIVPTGDIYCVNAKSTIPGSQISSIQAILSSDTTKRVTCPNPIDKIKKLCTGRIEVKRNGRWSKDGVLYNEEQLYRVVVEGSDPSCVGGTITVNGNINTTGGVFTGSNIPRNTLNADYTFLANIEKPEDALPIKLRGLYGKFRYQPAGTLYSYGLTELIDDFSDKPLTIIGDDMRGVLVNGQMAGDNSNPYNQNSTLFTETSNTIANSRNQFMKNVALLTRKMEKGTIVNNVYYLDQGNVYYSKDLKEKEFETVIIRGGNLIIDENIDTRDIGIIVVKDSNNKGGDIIVNDNVTKIQASIFSEGTFRGENSQYDVLHPDRQLVLIGSLFSVNTIGGSADPKNLFLAGKVPTQNKKLATEQDLNNVRNGNINTDSENYNGLDDPFIIEYRLSNHPGFTEQL